MQSHNSADKLHVHVRLLHQMPNLVLNKRKFCTFSGLCPGTMLPTTSAYVNGDPNSRDAARHTAGAKRYKYLRRLLHFRQMDFDFAVWQMLYLFTSPQRVYRNFHYRKQTKDQWARDDPAFLVLLSIWLCGKQLVISDL